MIIKEDAHLNCTNCYYRNACPNSILPVAASNCTRYKINPEYIKGEKMSKPLTCDKCFLHDKGCNGVEICEYFAPKDGRTIPGGYYDQNQKAKSDDGKPKLSIVPIKIIFAIEKIRKYGNNKYPEGGSDNWKTVEPERHYEASLRHTAKHWNDPFAIDPESGLPHYFHKVCDDAFFIEQNWDKFMEAIEKYKEEKK